MKKACAQFLWAGALALTVSSSTWSQDSIRVVSRGEMLYSLHCVACHSKEIHWRDKALAKDWPTLVAEVDRWQKIGHQGWDKADIIETARYVNRLHYRFPEPE